MVKIKNEFASNTQAVSVNKAGDLRIGEFLKTRVLGFSDGKPVISIKGEILTAESKVALKPNQELTVYVEKKEEGKTFLKIVDSTQTDPDSKILNQLVSRNLPGHYFNVVKSLMADGLSMESSISAATRGFQNYPAVLDLYRSGDFFSGKITDFLKLIDFIEKNLENDLVSKFMDKFILKNPSKEEIIDYVKNSLNSFENKLLKNTDISGDLKNFLMQSSKPEIENIIKFIDLNNVLNSNNKYEAIINIPFFNQNNEKSFSQLELKSEGSFKNKKTVNIFFILDMSNAGLLQIDALYYIEGKNLTVNFYSEKENFLSLIKENISMLTEPLKKRELNVLVTTSLLKKKNDENVKKTNKISSTYSDVNNKKGVDIKA